MHTFTYMYMYTAHMTASIAAHAVVRMTAPDRVQWRLMAAATDAPS